MSGIVDRASVSFDGWSAECEARIRREQRFDQLASTVKRSKGSGSTLISSRPPTP